MAQKSLSSFFGRAAWTCRRCRTSQWTGRSQFSTSISRREELEIRAAPEIDFERGQRADAPARILPASPSYFTGAPIFNDDLLVLQSLLNRYQKVPQLPADKAPRMAWLRLSQYRNASGERVGAAKYAQILRLLTRLNRIHPQLRSEDVQDILVKFLRPGAQEVQKAKPGTIDVYGRSKGVGRRKESSAKVYLVEGTGEILVNGKSIVQVFPRLHDRESAMWPLKVSERIDKYNVFALVAGGGITGQAEAVTLGLARALLVHEPALKPVLRRGKRDCSCCIELPANRAYSWLCHTRPSSCREKEAWSTEGQKEVYMGQEINVQAWMVLCATTILVRLRGTVRGIILYLSKIRRIIYSAALRHRHVSEYWRAVC